MENTCLVDFSIIIVTRNRPDELRKCVDSITRTGYSNLELIVVDNNSEEKSSSRNKVIIEKASILHKTMKHNSENRGVSGGRNDGISLAKGKYLFFIDDDAYIIDREFFAKAKAIFETREKTGIVSCNIVDTVKWILIKGEVYRNSEGDLNALSFRGGGHFIRRQLFVEKVIPVYPNSLFYGNEELYLSYLALGQGVEILFAPELIVIHNPSESERVNTKQARINNIVNKAVVNLLVLPTKYRRRILLNFTLRMIKYFSLDPISFVRAVLLLKKRSVHERIDDSSVRVTNDTVKFLLRFDRHLF
ncbi:glycosyltransferase family 2 protein [Mesotoga sp. H07.pep.5.3]|uniref:glycosyltransferase family 2 protein n=1 Tax=Mesotoga sp. H07.pep.5.3 TaxID=1421003 RepID=UPI000C18F1AD|nr:glycosyltransferase [Mesotoga sp. H07.pep.5.3]PIJ63020.1 hypothetical protein V513_02665 [Mesotoga sp. H07.pep.5.3]